MKSKLVERLNSEPDKSILETFFTDQDTILILNYHWFMKNGDDRAFLELQTNNKTIIRTKGLMRVNRDLNQVRDILKKEIKYLKKYLKRNNLQIPQIECYYQKDLEDEKIMYL